MGMDSPYEGPVSFVNIGWGNGLSENGTKLSSLPSVFKLAPK